MTRKKSGIKFYGINDLSTSWQLEQAASILEFFDEHKRYADINEVIELYNIQKLVNSGAYLQTWDEVTIDRYRQLCNSTITKILGRFLGEIDDQNFLQSCHSVWPIYVEDYWKLIVKFKVYQRISAQTFSSYIWEEKTALDVLLQNKDLVTYYGEELAACLRESNQTPRLIVNKFLEKHEHRCTYSFPKEFLPSEYENILQKYVHSKDANLNILQLLVSAQSSKECPISDKLRLAAKRACDSYWDERHFTGVEVTYGINVQFAENPDFVSIQKEEGNVYQFTYDIGWLQENLDYPTVLNNFRYVFEQFDFCWRSNLVSLKTQLGIFEKTIFTRGIRDYIIGNRFCVMDKLSTMQLQGYYEILKNNEVHLESVFQWFFEEYLPNEFDVHGFRFNPPSIGTTLVEKCRTIASEMEGVLKQFRMHVQDGKIDQELFEISSEHIIFSNIPSLLSRKYVYGNSLAVQREHGLLFSDQCLLSCIERIDTEYETFYQLLLHERVKLSDFKTYQHDDIEWLLNRDIITKTSDGILGLNHLKACILKDLYEHEVICFEYYDKGKKVIEEWAANEDLMFESTLFSRPEQDYLNYTLNKSVFSNGLDLRNKYSHSTYPSDPNTQLEDYMILLKTMVLVITKINEEFCLQDAARCNPET